MLTDTHAHLDFPQFASDLDGILERAHRAGVHRIITIGTSLEGSRRAVALADRYTSVWATVGIHPTSVETSSTDDLPSLRELARHPRVVGIGEIGFDYHWLPSAVARREGTFTDENAEFLLAQDAASQKAQLEVFHAQMELAADMGLNVVIHQRAAWEDTIAALHPHLPRTQTVFHCFTENQARADELLSLGGCISFTGIVTFKNTAALQQTVAQTPSGRFMVETDSPYLAPVPYRGKTCEPAYTRFTAEHISILRQQSLPDLAAETEATANSFFWKERRAAS